MSSPYNQHLGLLPLNDQEKEEFSTSFFSGLVVRGLEYNIGRFWLEVNGQFGGILNPPFALWFFKMISLRGRDFTRELWKHLTFVRSSFPVLCEYIEESQFYGSCFA